MPRRLTRTMKDTLSHRRGLPVLAALGVLAAAGVATAAIPSADGTIKACYATSSGTPRIVDQATTCRSGEAALTWNQRGQQGPQGPQGPQGERGLQGPAGADGADGAPGTRVVGGQFPGGIGTTTSCHDVNLVTQTIHLDTTSIVHVETSAIATGHSAGRFARLAVTLDPPGGFGTDLQGMSVPVGDGQGLVVVSGFVPRFGSGAHTFEPGDYVLTVDGRSEGPCDGNPTDFSSASAVWFTASPQ